MGKEGIARQSMCMCRMWHPTAELWQAKSQPGGLCLQSQVSPYNTGTQILPVAACRVRGSASWSEQLWPIVFSQHE